MNTNDKIQAVLATGELGLPEGVRLFPNAAEHIGPWEIFGKYFGRDEPPIELWDTIAAHWARERPMGCFPLVEQYNAFAAAMIGGDSEAAISAIHAALCGEESDDA